MKKGRQYYGSLDWFRLIAAALVIIIHTSPFEYINPWVDLFFTGILGRIAVPFFFMTTGFFTDFSNGEKIKKSVKKLLIMYGVSILIYLPIGFLAGDYKGDGFFTIFKKILFDGTYYHLWYFPAAVLGLLIVYGLKKIPAKKSRKTVLIIASILYLLGLFGDNYYGISVNIPPLNVFYNALFNIFSNTRNGLFFAPLFLVLGSEIHNFKIYKKPDIYVLGAFFSFIFMTVEATLLNNFNIPRHCSMYIFLIPTMVFLFMYLLTKRSPSRPKVRKASMWIYILHPFIIIVLHNIEKILKIPDYEINLAVVTSFLSIIISFIAGFVLPLVIDVIKNKLRASK